ncbi:MAG TPA: PAS domain S-box protein [Syntrophorhabdaceae bacterium]|nr:PAS domain S-box protein [Syntrophorhabdaceae bacterium]
MRNPSKSSPNAAGFLTEPFLFVLILLVAFVLVFGSACLVAYHSYRNAVHYAIQSDETRAKLIGGIVLEHHKAALGIVQSYASRPLLVDAVRKKDFKKALFHLTSLSTNNPEFATSWISNPDSTAWVNFPVDTRSYGRDLTQRDWYKGVSEDWRPYVSDIYKLITQEQGLAVSLCVPIYDEKNKVIGIFGSSMTTKFYNDLVRHVGLGMDANVTLVDRAGHIIYGDRYPGSKDVVLYPLFDTVKKTMAQTGGTIEVRDISDRSQIEYVSLAPVEEIGWSVIVERTKSGIVRLILRELIQIGVISLLIFMLAVFLAVNWMNKRKQIKTLKEQSDILREQALLLDLSHDAILVRDPESRIVFWNRGAEETYGWTREEALGNITHIFLKTVFPISFDVHMKELNREGRWEGELIHTRKGGSRLTVLSRQVLQLDETGKPIGILEINIDITDRKRAEIALLASEQRWATTLASIGDAVISTDTSGSVTYMNATAEALTGWTLDDALQKAITEVFHIINEETRLEVENPISKVLREGMIVGLANHTLLVKKDGTEIPIDDSGAPIRDKEGRTQGVVLIFRDITERKQAEQALRREIDERRQTEDQLRQSQKMEAVGTLTGGIAHDFNNILAAILGFTEMALEDAADRPEVGRSLQNVLKSAMRARELVKQILAFSRKTNYERSPLSLTSLMKETVQFLRASIPSTISIDLATTASSDTILAAPVEVQQIIMNLATNASLAMQEKGGTLEITLSDIDFTPESPVLELGVMPGEYVQLTVKDTGIGMTPDVMKRVFEPFFTTREVGKGTGMGLAVVYGIVKDLQGTITVESEPGAGSTFRVLLPKVKASPLNDEIRTVQAARGTEHILFIDDEPMLTEWGKTTLTRLGYTVTAVTDSKDALNIFFSDPSVFDLIITDHTMPGITGVRFAKELLKIKPDIPIILCTGHSETVSPEIAKEAGIREYLMKPLAKEELAQAIRRVLDAKKEE